MPFAGLSAYLRGRSYDKGVGRNYHSLQDHRPSSDNGVVTYDGISVHRSPVTNKTVVLHSLGVAHYVMAEAHVVTVISFAVGVDHTVVLDINKFYLMKKEKLFSKKIFIMDTNQKLKLQMKVNYLIKIKFLKLEDIIH